MLFFRKIRSRRLYAHYPAFRAEIVKGFREHVGPDLVRLFKATSAYWRSNQPEFKAQLFIANTAIGTDVLVSGIGATLWNAHNEGVDARVITPRPERRHRISMRRRRTIGREGRRVLVQGKPTYRPALRFPGVGGNIIYRYSANWKGIKAKD